MNNEKRNKHMTLDDRIDKPDNICYHIRVQNGGIAQLVRVLA